MLEVLWSEKTGVHCHEQKNMLMSSLERWDLLDSSLIFFSYFYFKSIHLSFIRYGIGTCDLWRRSRWDKEMFHRVLPNTEI